MKSSQRARLAGISSMVAGALTAGGSTLTIEVDAELLPRARDIVSSMVGGEQDSLTQLDDRDVYRWTVEPTRDRDIVAIQLVWHRPGQATKPADVIPFADRLLDKQLRESLAPCSVCRIARGAHTKAQRAVCDALAGSQPDPLPGA